LVFHEYEDLNGFEIFSGVQEVVDDIVVVGGWVGDLFGVHEYEDANDVVLFVFVDALVDDVLEGGKLDGAVGEHIGRDGVKEFVVGFGDK